ASGMPLGRFLEERVFKPLKMADSGFFVEKDKLGRVAEALPGWPIKLLDVTAPPKNDSGGAGGVSTAADYLRFSQMLLNGGQLDGARVLSRSTVGLMASDHLAKITVGVTPTPSPGELFRLILWVLVGLVVPERQGRTRCGQRGVREVAELENDDARRAFDLEAPSVVDTGLPSISKLPHRRVARGTVPATGPDTNVGV